MKRKGKYNSPFQATIQGIRDLYRKREDVVALPDPLDMKGRRVLITGASSGLGFATAKRMANAGAELILATRSGIPEKGEAIIAETGNRNVRMLHVDLSDFNSIDGLVDQLRTGGIAVDLVVSNAAMVPLKSRQTPQGLDEMFMVNYLAPFYLINRILESGILEPSAEGRPGIIIVSSESHRNPEGFDWANFGKYTPYGIKETVAKYGEYKLFLTTFANELARRLETRGNHIPVRSLCPGPVNSNIGREAPGWMQPLLKLSFSLFFKSPKKASDPVLYFATETPEKHIPIRYLFLMQEKEMDDKSTDPANGQKLWEKSEEIISGLGYRLE